MWRLLLVSLSGLLLAGCMVGIPAKYQVTDLQSGKSFTTYSDMGKENMLGYNFRDLGSGEMVMLRSYTVKVLTPGGAYEPDSPQAMEFRADRKQH